MSTGKGNIDSVSMSCSSKNARHVDETSETSGMSQQGERTDDEECPSALNVDPKENLKLRPKKGILKSTSSFDNERKMSQSYNREAHFDEMNILATFHPADKDYGHMKVDEPKTPFHHYSDSEGEEGTSEGVRRVSLSEPLELDPKCLEEKIKNKMQRRRPSEVDNDDDEEEEMESEERIAKRKAFEMKRKQHYNEFQAVKLAKQLIEEDEKDSTNDDEDNRTGK